MIDAMKRPNWRLPISSFAIAKMKLGNRGRLKTIIRMHTPRTKAMFTMLEPNTFPIETPTLAGFATAKTETLSSGNEVAKPTSTNPMVVFPKPVASEIFMAFLMVNSLPTTRRTIEASRMIALPSRPNPSNVALHLFSILLLEQG